VLDDDVVLHKQTRQLFATTYPQVPPDWLILQLGTLQYHWEEPWMTWRSECVYSSNGAAIGSHAVGIRSEVIPFLLEQVRRRELPYDDGALSAATRAFKNRNFVIFPNLAIQDLESSDIQSSGFQHRRSREEIAETYRWKLSDYDF